MNEKQIQHKLIMWFSQEYPQHRGLLFEVNNDTYNIKHAMKRRSMGMISGVSDLILILPKIGRVACIELKAPKSTHSKDHIENQINWGEKIIQNKGFYLITSEIEVAKEFIQYLINGNVLMPNDIQLATLRLIKMQFSKKTVKF